MKRDMDLVREILMVVAECDDRVDYDVFVNDCYDKNFVIYTIELMKEAGLLKANVTKAYGGDYVSARIDSLTWQGHEFLGNIKNDKVWAKVKKILAKTCKSASIDVVKKIAEKIVLDMVFN